MAYSLILWASKKLGLEEIENGEMVWRTEKHGASKTQNPLLGPVSMERKEPALEKAEREAVT